MQATHPLQPRPRSLCCPALLCPPLRCPAPSCHILLRRRLAHAGAPLRTQVPCQRADECQRMRSLAWPAQLQAALQAEWGPHVVVASGAVRASSADFPTLCWDEVWGEQWAWGDRPRAPRLDLVIIDYLWTSDLSKLTQLHKLTTALGIPTIGMILCGWRCDLPRETPTARRRGQSFESIAEACLVPSERECIKTQPGAKAYYHAMTQRWGAPAFLTGSLWWRRPGSSDRVNVSEVATPNLLDVSPFGHKLLAEHLLRRIIDGCREGIFERPIGPPQTHLDLSAGQDVCRIGFHLDDLVVARHGFERVDPGEARTPGLAATSEGASLTFALQPHGMRRGFVRVSYERGWRNELVGRLSCEGACDCAPVLLNASQDPAGPFRVAEGVTLNVFSDGTEARLQADARCLVRVEVLRRRHGRLFLTALTLSHRSAPLGDLSLELDSAARLNP